MSRPLSLGMWAFSVCGAWLIALGLYFMFMRPALLPEDIRYIGANVAQIQVAAPGLESWLHRVYTVLGGFIAGTGVLTILTARTTLSARKLATTAALVLAGLLTVTCSPELCRK